MRRYTHTVFAIVVLLAGLASTAMAQGTTGSISGLVVDQSKSVLPGVSVEVRNVDTGVVRSLVTDESGILADAAATDEAKAPILETMFAAASPSPRSMRAGPEYRLAMLRVLGRRALATAIERLAAGE